MKRNYKSNNKKAFTLVELLIVIAIIGILFVVLVSRVDFATDKAKATGVQTDFRSFQVALDQVAKENAGFNVFGWDTGDADGDRIRNSYDRGDTNHNGKEDPGETFIGRKEYGEDWTTIYTMLNPKVGMENDDSAFKALEAAINANLDPKLHITITPDVEGGNLTGNATITMANQARDPWKNEYHGVFITNAARDNGADRGAIIIYSNGANGKWGSAHDITNGVVSVTVPNNNKHGQDDYSITSCYTYTNGYGEVLNMTTGFSSNQNFLSNGGSTNTPGGGNNGNNGGGQPGNSGNNEITSLELGKSYTFKSNYNVETIFALAMQSLDIDVQDDGSAMCPLYVDDNIMLMIAGYHPDDIPDAYIIGIIDDDETTLTFYCSSGYIPIASDSLSDEFSSVLTGSGWYKLDLDPATLTKISAPSITFSNEGILAVPTLNTLLPLFSDADASPSLEMNIKFDRWYTTIDEDGDTGYMQFGSDGSLITDILVLPAGYIVYTPTSIILRNPSTGEIISSVSYTSSVDGNTLYFETNVVLTLETTPPPTVKPTANVYYKHGGMKWNFMFTIDGGMIYETYSDVSYYAPSQIVHHGNSFYIYDASGSIKYVFKYNSTYDYICDFDFSANSTTDTPLKVYEKIVYSSDFKTCLGYSNSFDQTLANITIADGTTKIAASFFKAGRPIHNITIPASVTTIENANFDVFEDLSTIYFQGTAQQWAAFNITLPAGVNIVFE